MRCMNPKCPYYKKPEKTDWFERSIGVTSKSGGCDKPYCTLKKRKEKR